MADEKVEQLISQQALQGFDDLNAKVNASVRAFEEFLSKAVAVNSALSNTKGLKDTNDLMNQLSERERELAKAQQELLDLQNQLANKSAANTKAQQQQTTITAQQTHAIEDNVAVMQRYQTEVKRLNAEMKKLGDQFKAGTISADQYEKEMAQLGRQEKVARDAVTNLNGVLRLQVKEQNSASGSVEQLKAKLGLLTKAYDNLDHAQRKSAIGMQVKGQLNAVTDQLTKLEQGTGRFQRQVGQYQQALGGIGAAIGPLVAAVIGLGSISQFFSATITEAQEADKNATRFRNTLEGIGKTEALSRLNTEADRLAKNFGYLDNDDVIDTFNKLFTYGKLNESQIKELTPVIINFAAKAQIPLAEATEKIIGAMEGNGKALKQYGINVKDGQNSTERFGIIMTDLKSKVEGAGESFRNSLAGGVAESEQRLRDLEETVGKDILPMWNNIKIGAITAFQGIIEGIQTVIDKFNYGMNVFRGFVQGGAAGAAAVVAERRAEQASQAIQKLRDDAAAFGDSYVRSLNGNVKAMEKELATARLMIKTDAERANQLKKRSSDDPERQQALQSLYNTAAIIKALKTEIRVRGEKATTIEKEKEVHQKRISFYDDELKAAQDFQTKQSENEALFLGLRLDARRKAVEIEKRILEGQREAELRNADGTGADRINQSFNFKRVEAERKAQEDITKIRNQFNIARRAEENATNAAFLEDFKRNTDARIAAVTAAFVKEQDRLTGNQSVEVGALNRQYENQLAAAGNNKKKRERLEEEYGKKRMAIDQYYAEQILMQEIRLAEAIIAVQKGSGQDVGTKEAALAALKQKYSDMVLAHIKSNNAEEIKSHDQKYQRQIEALNTIQNYSNQVFDIIGSAVNAGAIADKNKLREESDELERNAQREIDMINASTDAEEKKAARVQLVNAQTQSKKEELAQKQRAIDQRTAEFEKARSISAIILNTAVAVVTALKTSVFAAIAAGAIGAAQLAVAISTPIPRFETGTLDAPGGQALVGEKRSELMVTPDGRLTYIPKGPKVMNVPKHSIIFPDAQLAMESGIGQGRLQGLKGGDDNLRKLADVLGGKMDKLTKTVRDKTENHWHPKKDGWERIKQHGNISTKRI